MRVQHIARPSRALLEGIRDHWLAAESSVPPGHASEEKQAQWEGPIQVGPQMTEEEAAAVKDAAEGPPRIRAIKAAARRIGAGIKEALLARCPPCPLPTPSCCLGGGRALVSISEPCHPNARRFALPGVSRG